MKRCPLFLQVVVFFVIAGVFFGPGCWSQTSAQSRSRAAMAESRGSIALNSNVTILLGSEERGPVQEATKDLQTDLGKVFGKKPRIVSRLEDAGPLTIRVGENSQLPEGERRAGLTEPESFSISIVRGQAQPATTILLAGADMRGTIYAVYQFSQEYLGVDPLYYWTDKEPAARSEIELPADLSERFPAPVIKYRGLFINDEDLLTGWAPGEQKDHTGISLAVWNKVFETILRLKGNIVVPGTWIFPDDPQVKLAGERGLILTQHHAIPLGVNVARWPKDVPYNYSTHPEILERAWKNAVASYAPNQEILWSVGLRGLSDVSYASMDPSVVGNDKALGQLISKAIVDQMGIVRAAHPDAKFVTDFWQEGARLVHQGDLTIPPEVIRVWADTGYGYLQDDGQVAAGEGAYYHVAMMNGRANQLSEMVPVDRIASELGRYIKAGATQYVLLNTSDIRPVTMTTRSLMEIAWKGSLAGGGGDATDKYYHDWAKEEFGARAADVVAEVYKEYFKAPAHDDATPPHEYGDQLYHTEARELLLTYMTDAPLYSVPSQAPEWAAPRIMVPGFGRETAKEWMRQTAAKEIQECGDAQPRWDSVWQKALAAKPLVEPDRVPFYEAEVLAMIAINRESNRMLYLVSKAIEDMGNGNKMGAREEINQALSALDQIHQAESAAEYGKWKNWYRGDWLTGVYRTRQIVEVFSKYIDDPLTHLAPPLSWSGWEAYYHIMHYEGQRSVDVH